jgi:large subunit ribosomal protein L2
MGKRIISRARGKGGLQYRSPSFRYRGRVSYPPAKKVSGKSGVVKDILNDPARSAPVAVVKFPWLKDDILQIAPEGLHVGDKIEYDGSAKLGNVLELKDIPVGVRIFGLENTPNSGPKLCRSSGSFAIIMSKSEKKVIVKFSSGKTRALSGSCRATIGVPAGGGRSEKPFLKAGKRHKIMRARGKLYPRTSGVAMTPTDHPYGGKRKAPRPSGTTSRNAPPGAKVGSVAARRTGRRKGSKAKKR